jgi:RecB family exonuclease
MVRGTSVHASVRRDLAEKREKGTLLPLDAVKDFAAEALDNTWLGEEPQLNEEEREVGAKAVKARTKEVVVALSVLHHVEVAPKITPIHLEREFRVVLNGFPFDLGGTIDLQEPEDLVDTKTGSKSPAADAADKSVQLTMYSLAAKALDGKAPKTVRLDYLVDTKTPKAVSLTSTRTDDDRQRLLLRVEHASRVIQSGAFMPTDASLPGVWWCSEQFCGFWKDVCPFGRRNRTQV